ncbi:hypothetical protein SAMN05216388_10348 [Halorientalis persicus]|uniref:Uncharacterized protein n=1 Tax=Halorientalis persicus TaxID=1367881 RepID=A0A1H8V705_9EURY|nr:hypothetical protein SAMN05216388_10348 [Halorientalis persicus]
MLFSSINPSRLNSMVNSTNSILFWEFVLFQDSILLWNIHNRVSGSGDESQHRAKFGFDISQFTPLPLKLFFDADIGKPE